jgi:hypothetical protein
MDRTHHRVGEQVDRLPRLVDLDVRCADLDDGGVEDDRADVGLCHVDPQQRTGAPLDAEDCRGAAGSGVVTTGIRHQSHLAQLGHQGGDGRRAEPGGRGQLRACRGAVDDESADDLATRRVTDLTG